MTLWCCQTSPAAAARLLIEKPFGYDLLSAKELIAETGRYFSEEQIFRIDHYVAKETVQNIVAFRMNNPLFRAVWDAKHIHHIEITATEKIDIEGRATFFEETGALRDFVQSHLMQLLALLTMEEPANLSSEVIHRSKAALLKHIRPVPETEIWRRTVRGQYAGYTEEVQNPHSVRETFAALLLYINLPRWRNMPVLIKTGKALSRKETKLVVVFKDEAGGTTNRLFFKIQPAEGVALTLLAKRPGYEDELEPVTMNFSYEQTFEHHGHPDAYERVLVDAMKGDHTLFSTSTEVLASWKALETIIRSWESSTHRLHIYAKGSLGPDAAKELAEAVSAQWY